MGHRGHTMGHGGPPKPIARGQRSPSPALGRAPLNTAHEPMRPWRRRANQPQVAAAAADTAKSRAEKCDSAGRRPAHVGLLVLSASGCGSAAPSAVSAPPSAPQQRCDTPRKPFGIIGLNGYRGLARRGRAAKAGAGLPRPAWRYLSPSGRRCTAPARWSRCYECMCDTVGALLRPLSRRRRCRRRERSAGRRNGG